MNEQQRVSGGYGALIPSILKSLAIIAAGILFLMGQEHRLTVMEANIKSLQDVVAEAKQTQQLLSRQLLESQTTLNKLVVLEDFIHGMSPDEASAAARYPKRR